MPSRYTRRSASDRRVALALVCAWGLLSLGASAIAATRTVIIEGLKYAPETLTVRRGDTIVWINKDAFPHTVTAKGVVDSRSIAAGHSWKYIAREPGEHAYTCTFHPNMKGKVRVE